MNDQQSIQPNISQKQPQPQQDFQPETPQKRSLPVWAVVLIAVLSAIVVSGISYAAYLHFVSKPIPEPIDCTMEYAPVCGVDGKTYSNDCFAGVAGVEIDYQGECGEGTEPIGCTEEAKVCPDGSTVFRIPPDCEFAPCLEVADPITEKATGYIKTVYEKDGKRYLDIDYIQWFSGEEAIKVAMEDTGCEREQITYCAPSLNNGFYIRNQNPKIRTFEISNNAEIIRASAFDFSPSGEKVITYEEFKSLFVAEDSYFRNIPFYIEVVDNFVIKITEQYIP